MALFIYGIFYIALVTSSCDAYKALVATMMPSKSHAILNEGIVRQLLKDGNEVTYIRSNAYENPPPTLREIDVSSNEKAMPDSVINIKHLMDHPDEGSDHRLSSEMMTEVSVKTLENEDVQRLLSDPKEHFDVVIVEYINNEVLASLAAVFGCPLIWLSPIEINSGILSIVDAMPNPAHIPNSMSINLAPFSFQQRLQELWDVIKYQYYQYIEFNSIKVDAYNRLVAPLIAKRGRVPPSFDEIRYNASLVLSYSHVSMGEAFNLPQNFKPVGGYHIDGNIKPLPEDLKKIMDNAKNGVIYFSMGSNLKSTDWPEETKQDLLKMLGGLKQTVLWKFEQQLPNIPKNVHISKWFPQMSILSHLNCVLFITHGGLLSTAEALHIGIPIIGIPGFGDQFINIKRAAVKGFGLEVPMSYNIVENLKVAIEEITSNPKYREKAKEFSFIYHNRPVKPSEELAFWVRHVVETGGAPHLRSPSINMPLYQSLYLDLVAIILVGVMFIVMLFRSLCSIICSKKTVRDSKSENKKRKKRN